MTTTGLTAGRREWTGLAVLALPTLLLALDMSVLFLALPHLTADLGASSVQQLWIMDIYGFMIAGFLVTMGTLGDRIGRRRLLLIGAAAFSAASVLAAFATSAEALIAARAVLGIAGATLMPSTLALISNMFRDSRQRAVAISVWMSCFMVGTAIGPLVGGVLLELFWWGAAFLLGVPVMVLLLVAGRLLLPEYRDPRAGRIDLISVGLSLAAVLPVIYGLKELARDGARPVPVLAALIGLTVGLVFVRRQRRLADPLLDLALFRSGSFSAALGINLVGAIVMGGSFLFVPLYLQLVEGMTPLRAGLWLLPQSIAMIASSLAAPHLAHRYRPAYVMAAGLVIGAAGFVLITRVGAGGGLFLVVTGFLLACVGVAPAAALGTDLVVGSAPPEKAGSASSVSETTNEFGIALGLASLGSLGTAVYRNAVEGKLPAGVPEAAGESMSGAAAVAEQLPGSLGAELLALARTGFTSGMSAVAVIGAVGFVAAALLALVLFRGAGPAGYRG
jgi:MFS transporter, DHA2 family, multidrug resistance protein